MPPAVACEDTYAVHGRRNSIGGRRELEAKTNFLLVLASMDSMNKSSDLYVHAGKWPYNIRYNSQPR